MSKDNIKIFDVFNTDYGAYRLLRTRVQKIDEDQRFENFIVCPDGEYSKKMKSMGVKIINISINDKSINPFTDRHSIKELFQVFKENKPDIVHTHTSKGGYVGRIAAKRAGVPNVIHQVHGFHFTQLFGIKKKIYASAEKWLAKYADVLLFQNMNEFDLSKKMGFEKYTNLLYIGNGIPMEEFKDVEVRSSPRLGEKLKIVCIARLEPVKNHKMLFEVAKILKRSGLKFEISLVGDGYLRSEYEKLCEELKISDVVKFIGNVDRDQIKTILSTSHISVLTSFKEGKPRSLMESQIVGLPVIATDVIGTNEVVVNEKTGFLTKVGDAETFANKIILLYEKSDLWKEMSKNARKNAKEHFDEDIIVDRLKKIYISMSENRLNEFIKSVDNGQIWFEGVK